MYNSQLAEIEARYHEIAGLEIGLEKIEQLVEQKNRELARILEETGYGYGYVEESRKSRLGIALTEEAVRLIGFGAVGNDDREGQQEGVCQ